MVIVIMEGKAQKKIKFLVGINSCRLVSNVIIQFVNIIIYVEFVLKQLSVYQAKTMCYYVSIFKRFGLVK